jgi:chaperone modulatory protein CbpM
LIQDLKHDMGVNDEGVGIILNLLDQMHSLRKAMADMAPSKRGRSDLP